MTLQIFPFLPYIFVKRKDLDTIFRLQMTPGVTDGAVLIHQQCDALLEFFLADGELSSNHQKKKNVYFFTLLASPAAMTLRNFNLSFS